MIIALQIDRVLMIAWILYALFRLFAPHILHQPSNDVVASVNAVAAFALGHLIAAGWMLASKFIARWRPRFRSSPGRTR